MNSSINLRQEALDALQTRFRRQVEPFARPVHSLVMPATATPSPTDTDLLRRAMDAKNGVKFRSLWNGDTSGHGEDDSSADMALCSLLAFWTCRDAEQMDRLFRESGLMRPKWNEQRGSETYGQLTVRRAVQMCRETYDPAGHACTQQGQPEEPYRPAFNIVDWQASTAFAGEPRPREYLVGGIFPMGQVSLLGAQGGVGKSFSILSMLLDVARWGTLPVWHFGGPVMRHGAAVYLSGEDDDIELHSRLDVLGGKPANLYAVPLPSAGGAPILFKTNPQSREPMSSQAWDDIGDQLREIRPVVVGLDPLQVFCSLDLNVPENAQFVCTRLSALAAELGAAVIVTHHFKKTTVPGAAEAREAIRGTAALVDGVRCVYAMWPTPDGKEEAGKGARAICRALNAKHEPDKIIYGTVVKANGNADRKITTFMRGENGLLVDVTVQTKIHNVAAPELRELIQEAIARAAVAGQPYTKTGQNGLFARRHEMGEPLNMVAKGRFADLAQELLEGGRVVLALAAGSKSVKWLDVPDGPFALGGGTFCEGFLSVKKTGAD